ncbi:formyltransferase family protein [Pseudonocardia sulfidoxydans]|uniref:formyltransferase family protein n=1 Tax=Pseudonocardia sulfidoxydans TaxID=54011 RepID=UPI00361BF1C8
MGSGALVWRAATYAVSQGRTVDAVVHPRGEAVPARARGLERRETDDVNDLAAFLDRACTDRLVCSTGNPFLFRAAVLDLGLTIVNVHGGPLPGYRGLPVVAAVFAILRGESEFGVTVHRVDAGIDTGAVVDRRTFPLSATVTLEELLLQITKSCHEIFVDNLADLGRAPAPSTSDGPGEYFGMKRLSGLADHRDHPAFARATDLGVLESFYPDYATLFAAAR